MGIGTHLAQQSLGAIGGGIRDCAVGFEINSQNAGLVNYQPVNDPIEALSAEFGGYWNLGQRCGCKGMRQIRMV